MNELTEVAVRIAEAYIASAAAPAVVRGSGLTSEAQGAALGELYKAILAKVLEAHS